MLNILNKIINFIYPKRCPFCDSVINSSLNICDECKRRIVPEFIKREIDLDDKIITCVSPFKYTGDVAEAIKKFKFRNRKEYSHCLSEFMMDAFDMFYKHESFDFVTAVPLHSKRKSERGYNQSELLCRGLCKSCGLVYKDVLKKDKMNLQQHSLSGKERESNIKGVYSTKNRDIIIGRKILICDDVITTGNTLKECCSVLYKHGVDKVCCITLASAK